MEEKTEMSEDRGSIIKKHFIGYLLPTNPLSIAIVGIFGALNCVLTMMISIPIPATQGFINIGDAGVMITGLMFGPLIGGLAGGIGSALADIFLGYTIYAPATLVIKGLEGFLVGLIANPRILKSRFTFKDILAILVGGSIMVLGYFLYESLFLGYELALVEVFLNGVIQFGIGGAIAIVFIVIARKNIIESLPQVFDKIFLVENI